MIACPTCGEDDDLTGTRLADGRTRISCGACGHTWSRGEARPPVAPRPAPPPPPAPAVRVSGHQVNERARTVVIAELERRGGVCRVEQVGPNRQEIRVRPAGGGPESAVVVRARTSGDWQTKASYGEPRTPEADPTRFWVFVDLGPARPVFYLHPEWVVLDDIHTEHQRYLAANAGHRAVNDDSDHHRITTERVASGRDRWDLLPGLVAADD